MIDSRPDLEEYYDAEKNDIPFSSLTYMSNRKVWWKCKNNHSYDNFVYSESRLDKYDCPICHERRKVAGVNTLDAKKPELILEWSENNERPISDFFDTESFKALWICPLCNGEYDYRICDRVKGDDSCPYCAGIKPLSGYNTLDITKPELASEWSYNNVRPMTDFLDTALYKALWICPTCNVNGKS